jgi:hypothetical protein
MSDIFIDFIGKLEEHLFVMGLDAFFTDIVVGFGFRFVTFGFGFYVFLAVVAVEVQHPLIVGFTQLVADAEHTESEVVVTSKDF